MKSVWIVFVVAALTVFAGCASQEATETDESLVEAEEAEPDQELAPETAEEPAEDALSPLGADGIAGFVLADGTAVENGASVDLTTGGAPSGRLVPASSNDAVTLYMTRDGSLPSADNNWSGAILPGDPPIVTRQLEGSGVYTIVAELDGEYSEPHTVYVSWRHEEEPELSLPVFRLNGEAVSGAVEVPVSDGSTDEGRLYIESNYAAATLYISRDGTEPSPEDYWKTQLADGTYLFSPEPTAAAYRVIAVWQGASSPVASLDVTWVD